VPTIETDPRKVHQILLNLVSNALKFTEKGSVTISATLQTRGGNHNKAEQVAIEVRDTGIGISREKQEHIFDAFYQVDSSNSRNYGGTGLGLSIVRELTTLLGGRVEIQSEPGQGSTFTIVLPIHLHDQRYMQDMRLNTLHQSGNLFGRQVAMEPVHVDTSRLELPQGEDGEYLVVAVDDNPDVLQLITASLEQTPYRVVGVQDSTQAVAVIQELKPKAITLDIMMPKVNGWQILHQLKSNPMTASIPVVLLTVLEDRSAGYVLGADEYLVKPVARDALLSVLQQLTQKQSAALNMDGTTNKEGSGIEQARPDLLMMLVNIDDSKVSVEQTSDDVIVDQASSPQLPPSVTPET
jgi:CheY-like chemotaxis protein